MPGPEATLIRDLQTLVDIPSVSIPVDVEAPTDAQLAPLGQTIDYLKTRVAEAGAQRGKPFFVKEFESRGRPIMVVGTHDTLTPDVALMVHLDVVAPHFPFELSANGQRATGRGVNDMKFAAAAGLTILEELPAHDNLSFSLFFTADEEVGGRDGAQVLYGLGYRPGFMLVPDGDSDNPWTVNRTSKGAWHFTVEDIPGQSGHASRPWLGDNAVIKAGQFAGRLLGEYPNPTSADPTAMTLNLADMGVPRHVDAKHNRIPDSAFLKFDGRFPGQAEMDAFATRLNELLAQHAPGARITTQTKHPFYEAQYTHPDFALFTRIMRDSLGQPVELRDTPSSTDAAHFPDVPSLVTMVESGGAHSSAEWVSLDGIARFVDMMRHYLADKRQIIAGRAAVEGIWRPAVDAVFGEEKA